MTARRVQWAVQASWRSPSRHGDDGSLDDFATQLDVLSFGSTRDAAVERATNTFAKVLLEQGPKTVKDLLVSVVCRPEFSRAWAEAGIYARPATGGQPLMQWHPRELFGTKPVAA